MEPAGDERHRWKSRQTERAGASESISRRVFVLIASSSKGEVDREFVPRALFLGAGFSSWAVGLPVANRLFDFAICVDGVREERRLAIVRRLKADWDGENPNGLAEQFVAFALSLPTTEKQNVLWYITRRLSEPFIWREFAWHRNRRHVLMINENRRFENPGIARARDFLQPFCGPDVLGIVTTNYDLLIEYALGTEVFNYGVRGQRLVGRGAYPLAEWRNPVALNGTVPVAKIHGSYSWDLQACYTDGRCGIRGRALIVAPTAEKNPPASLREVWRLAERTLSRATDLVVFGFAFNPYDEAVLSLLRECPALERVQLINRDPPIDRAKAIWPHACVTAERPPD
jgi:hypothetical protein